MRGEEKARMQKYGRYIPFRGQSRKRITRTATNKEIAPEMELNLFQSTCLRAWQGNRQSGSWWSRAPWVSPSIRPDHSPATVSISQRSIWVSRASRATWATRPTWATLGNARSTIHTQPSLWTMREANLSKGFVIEGQGVSVCGG